MSATVVFVYGLHGVDGGMRAHWAQNGFTALMYAAREGHMDCVRLLLEAGADTEAKSSVRYSDL